MKITNYLGLPQPVVDAIINDPYEKNADISVTDLINPPQLITLRERNKEKLEQDASDMIWLLVGKAVHHYLFMQHEKSSITPDMAEKRFKVHIDGITLSGQFDLYKDRILYDYKVIGLYSWKQGLKLEWEAQTNIYAWLCYQKTGMIAKELKIVCFLRDWMKSRASKDPNYPQSAVRELSVPFWDFRRTEDYVRRRIHEHMDTRKLEDHKLPSCSDEDTWQGKRCADYCIVSRFCFQNKSNLANEISERMGTDQ